jgi:sugar lactone lactonase YvrE
LYVGTAHGTIQKYDSDAHLVTAWTGGLGSADAMATDRVGNVYVADNVKRSIVKFSPSGARLAEWGPEPRRIPSGLAVDREGHIFVADTYSRQVQKLNASGHLLGSWELRGQPIAIATDPHGYVYVLQHNSRAVEKFHGNGEFVKKWGEPSGPGALTFPAGIAVWNNTVYVADTHINAIKQYSGDGEFRKTFGGDRPRLHAAPGLHEHAGRVVLHDPAVPPVEDVDVPVRTHRHLPRGVEHVGTRARLSGVERDAEDRQRDHDGENPCPNGAHQSLQVIRLTASHMIAGPEWHGP